jgi:hypothetical protein
MTVVTQAIYPTSKCEPTKLNDVQDTKQKRDWHTG